MTVSSMHRFNGYFLIVFCRYCHKNLSYSVHRHWPAVCPSVSVSVCVQGPLGQLKDLVELKDQLEDIQRRMEDEIQAGVPPVRLTQALICARSSFSALTLVHRPGSDRNTWKLLVRVQSTRSNPSSPFLLREAVCSLLLSSRGFWPGTLLQGYAPRRWWVLPWERVQESMQHKIMLFPTLRTQSKTTYATWEEDANEKTGGKVRRQEVRRGGRETSSRKVPVHHTGTDMYFKVVQYLSSYYFLLPHGWVSRKPYYGVRLNSDSFHIYLSEPLLKLGVKNGWVKYPSIHPLSIISLEGRGGGGLGQREGTPWTGRPVSHRAD